MNITQRYTGRARREWELTTEESLYSLQAGEITIRATRDEIRIGDSVHLQHGAGELFGRIESARLSAGTVVAQIRWL